MHDWELYDCDTADVRPPQPPKKPHWLLIVIFCSVIIWNIVVLFNL
jgi:hypothetical protein